eukprot:2839549-Rhodomonas_salina.2
MSEDAVAFVPIVHAWRGHTGSVGGDHGLVGAVVRSGMSPSLFLAIGNSHFLAAWLSSQTLTPSPRNLSSQSNFILLPLLHL